MNSEGCCNSFRHNFLFDLNKSEVQPDDQLRKTLELIKLERQADLEQYRQKVLLKSLNQRTKEGSTWYPVTLRRDYIGTGERPIIEILRTNNLNQPHLFQSGRLVNVFCNASGRPEKEHVSGVVNYVRDETMVITLNGDDFPEWLDDGHLGVDVMFDEMTYREMEYAMREVIKAEDNRVSELKSILLGEVKAEVENFPLNDEGTSILNDSQRAALKRALTGTDVAFIHGPPGTGKTTTLVEAINQTIRREGQVLVCAPSNAAIDLLVDKISERGLQAVRIGHPARVTEQTLSKTLDSRIATHPDFKELKGLRKRMEQLRTSALKYKRKFGYHEREQRRLMMQEVKLLKSDADMLEFHITNDILQNADAICTTLVGASHPVMRSRKFKTVFIDEAGQALEPACWIPLLRAHKVVFAGDHQQLPPTIKSIEASRQGLSTTLFEKGIARQPHVVSMLEVQYRMNDEIMKFPSRFFYDGKLVAHPSVKNQRLRPDQSPVSFIDTAGCGYGEQQDPETLSRYNIEEATFLIQRVEALIDDITTESWLAQRLSLGIITPYSAQVDHLRKLAEASPLLQEVWPLVTINTVDAFQGQERDVIAIGLVRSNEQGEVGFLSDIRRTNVAMTRAKKKLIIIGDSATLSNHPFYLELLEHVQAEGFYQSAFEFV